MSAENHKYEFIDDQFSVPDKKNVFKWKKIGNELVKGGTVSVYGMSEPDFFVEEKKNKVIIREGYDNITYVGDFESLPQTKVLVQAMYPVIFKQFTVKKLIPDKNDQSFGRLYEIKPLHYLYITRIVCEFHTTEPITSVWTMFADNEFAAPVAISNKYYYFLLDAYAVEKKYFSEKFPNDHSISADVYVAFHKKRDKIPTKKLKSKFHRKWGHRKPYAPGIKKNTYKLIYIQRIY